MTKEEIVQGLYKGDSRAIKEAIKALEQQPSDEIIKYLECNDIDVQKFTKDMKKQRLQAIKSNISEDCVSRQATLNAIIKELCIKDESYLLQSEKAIYNVVKNMPPVTPTQSWIPVSERLPEDRNIVLVTAYWHETYQVMMASYFGEGLWWCVPFNNCGDHMQKLNPKAWSPLPKPYEEKRGNSDGEN